MAISINLINKRPNTDPNLVYFLICHINGNTFSTEQLSTFLFDHWAKVQNPPGNCPLGRCSWALVLPSQRGVFCTSLVTSSPFCTSMSVNLFIANMNKRYSNVCLIIIKLLLI